MVISWLLCVHIPLHVAAAAEKRVSGHQTLVMLWRHPAALPWPHECNLEEGECSLSCQGCIAAAVLAACLQGALAPNTRLRSAVRLFDGLIKGAGESRRPASQ